MCELVPFLGCCCLGRQATHKTTDLWIGWIPINLWFYPWSLVPPMLVWDLVPFYLVLCFCLKEFFGGVNHGHGWADMVHTISMWHTPQGPTPSIQLKQKWGGRESCNLALKIVLTIEFDQYVCCLIELKPLYGFTFTLIIMTSLTWWETSTHARPCHITNGDMGFSQNFTYL